MRLHDTLDGVGPKLKKPLEKLHCTRVRDVAYHWPDRFVTRRPVDNLDEASEGEQIIIALTVTEQRVARAASTRANRSNAVSSGCTRIRSAPTGR